LLIVLRAARPCSDAHERDDHHLNDDPLLTLAQGSDSASFVQLAGAASEDDDSGELNEWIAHSNQPRSSVTTHVQSSQLENDSALSLSSSFSSSLSSSSSPVPAAMAAEDDSEESQQVDDKDDEDQGGSEDFEVDEIDSDGEQSGDNDDDMVLRARSQGGDSEL
jgi:hypothetical protein